MKGRLIAIGTIIILITIPILIGLPLLSQSNNRLSLGTTTSVYDTGLLSYILPDFEKRFDCTVDVIAAGSGQAINFGKSGDVDVLLVHSPEAELDFIEKGYGEYRRPVCYNRFVIVGPSSDPAGIHEAENATDAFRRIYENGTLGRIYFISRGDGSGTHVKELEIWSLIGLDSSAFSDRWYLKTGQGMGAVLDITQEKLGYTLSDEATFYTRRETGMIPNLMILYSGDAILFNQYSIILVNHTKWPHVRHELAVQFADWITSPEIQQMIGNFTDNYGHKLFVPNANVVNDIHSLSLIKDYYYLKMQASEQCAASWKSHLGHDQIILWGN
ncbi:MAG: substrate-binding domain-containing protein [Methanomassiliicoccales archaeon]